METINATIEWNEPRKQWDLYKEPGHFFLYNFYDCENMRKFFRLFDKSKTYTCQIMTVPKPVPAC